MYFKLFYWYKWNKILKIHWQKDFLCDFKWTEIKTSHVYISLRPFFLLLFKCVKRQFKDSLNRIKELKARKLLYGNNNGNSTDFFPEELNLCSCVAVLDSVTSKNVIQSVKGRQTAKGWPCLFSLRMSSSGGIFFWLRHTWLETEERRNSLRRFSTQFHDGFREEASQAFQVAVRWEGSIVEESR